MMMDSNDGSTMMTMNNQIIRHVHRGQAVNLSCPIDISSLMIIDHHQSLLLSNKNNNNIKDQLNDEFEVVWTLNGQHSEYFIKSNVNHLIYRSSSSSSSSLSKKSDKKNLFINSDNQQQQQQRIILVNNAVLVIKNDTNIIDNVGHIQCWLRNKNHSNNNSSSSGTKSNLLPIVPPTRPCEFEIRLFVSQDNNDTNRSISSSLFSNDDDDRFRELIENQQQQYEYHSSNHHCQLSTKIRSNSNNHASEKSKIIVIRIECHILGMWCFFLSNFYHFQSE